MGDLIPDPANILYQEWQGHKIICAKHAQGRAVRFIDKPTGAERCYYCQRQPEVIS